MGYMGFGMRKEVYTRKPKKAFAHRKQFDKREGSLRGKYTKWLPLPTESIIKLEGKFAKAGRYVKMIFILLIIAFILIVVANLISNVNDYRFGYYYYQ